MSGTESDISDTIVAKSDQLNADDLLAGPIVVTVTDVKRSSDEQPIAIHISGGRQPFKPCKTVRRILVFAWGKNASQWVGKSLKLIRDPDVKWAGVAVGGIRIAAMSHITEAFSMSLAESRKSKKQFRIEKLELSPDMASDFNAMKDRWKAKRESSGLAVDQNAFREFVATSTNGKIASTQALSIAAYNSELLRQCEDSIDSIGPKSTGPSEDVKSWLGLIESCKDEQSLTKLHGEFDDVREGRALADVEAIEAAFATRLEAMVK